MHDLADYEVRGIATVMVASDEFVLAAHKQAEALGLPELGERAVYVPHPIQDQTPQQIAARADAVAEEIVRRLTSKSSS